MVPLEFRKGHLHCNFIIVEIEIKQVNYIAIITHFIDAVHTQVFDHDYSDETIHVIANGKEFLQYEELIRISLTVHCRPLISLRHLLCLF